MTLYDHYCELLNLVSPFNPSFTKLSKLPTHMKKILTTKETELLSSTPVSPLALSLAIMRYVWGDLRILRDPLRLSSIIFNNNLSSKDLSALIHLLLKDSLLLSLSSDEKKEVLSFLYQNLKTDRFLDPFTRAKLVIISQLANKEE